MADTGYIYLNSLYNNSGFTDINFLSAQYTFDNPNDVIIYIKEVKQTAEVPWGSGNSHVITGYNYYLLGNNVVKNIQQHAINIYIRGEADGARYLNDSMDYINFDPGMYSTKNETYSMGGSGTNGYVYTSGQSLGYRS